MKDVGEKIVNEVAPKKWYPTVTIDADQFPYLKKKKVGENCVVEAKIRKVGDSLSKENGKSVHRVTLEILGMEEEKPKSISDAGHAILKEEYKEEYEEN